MVVAITEHRAQPGAERVLSARCLGCDKPTRLGAASSPVVLWVHVVAPHVLAHHGTSVPCFWHYAGSPGSN